MPQTYNGPDAGRFFPVPNEGVSKRRFGTITPNRIGIITIDMSAARARVRFKIAGTFLWCCDGTSTTVACKIAFKEDNGDDGITFKVGTQISGAEFTEVFITNTAQAGATMTFVYLVEENPQGFRISNPGVSTSSIALAPDSTVSTIADVTVSNAVVQILPTDANRRAAYIVNNSANAIRVGDQANVAVNRGVRIAGGASFTWTSTAPLHGIREGAADGIATITIEGV